MSVLSRLDHQMLDVAKSGLPPPENSPDLNGSVGREELRLDGVVRAFPLPLRIFNPEKRRSHVRSGKRPF